jgi:hypothetical protein
MRGILKKRKNNDSLGPPFGLEWRLPSFLLSWTIPPLPDQYWTKTAATTTFENDDYQEHYDACHDSNNNDCSFEAGSAGSEEESLWFLFLQGILSILSLIFVGCITYVLVQEPRNNQLEEYPSTNAALLPIFIVIFMGGLGLHQLWDLVAALQNLHQSSLLSSSFSQWKKNHSRGNESTKSLRFMEGTKFTRGPRPRRIQSNPTPDVEEKEEEHVSMASSASNEYPLDAPVSSATREEKEEDPSLQAEIRASARLELFLRIMKAKMESSRQLEEQAKPAAVRCQYHSVLPQQHHPNDALSLRTDRYTNDSHTEEKQEEDYSHTTICGGYASPNACGKIQVWLGSHPVDVPAVVAAAAGSQRLASSSTSSSRAGTATTTTTTPLTFAATSVFSSGSSPSTTTTSSCSPTLSLGLPLTPHLANDENEGTMEGAWLKSTAASLKTPLSSSPHPVCSTVKTQ